MKPATGWRSEDQAVKLVFSVAEAAKALGVSDDLIYELTERGVLPCLRLGRRKVLPVRVIEAVLEECLDDFKPAQVLASLGIVEGPPAER